MSGKKYEGCVPPCDGFTNTGSPTITPIGSLLPATTPTAARPGSTLLDAGTDRRQQHRGRARRHTPGKPLLSLRDEHELWVAEQYGADRQPLSVQWEGAE